MESFDGKEKTRKVSPKNETYLKKREENAKSFSDNQLFGAQLLSGYEQYSEMSEAHLPADMLATKERFNTKYLKELNKKFSRLLMNRETAALASEFLTRVISSSETVWERIEEFFSKVSPENASLDSTTDDAPLDEGDTAETRDVLKERVEVVRLWLLIHGELPLPVWIEILRQNRTYIEQRENELREKDIPENLERTRINLSSFLTQFGLDEAWTKARLGRLDSVAFKVIDEISSKLEKVGGRFDEYKNSIYLSIRLKEENIGTVIDHEVFHVLSGRLIYAKQIHENGEEPQELDENAFFESGRIGLRFPNRFGWLNEAVTEKLTKDFREYLNIPAGYKSYTEEIELLEYLCTQGSKPVPFELFVRAYFEDYEPKTNDDPDTIPGWKELRKELNESFGNSFLIDLDKRIKAKGVKAVLASLKGEISEKA